MKYLLQNWDPGAKYKRIATLQGGYNEWLNRYPQFVTNHDVRPPDVEENSINEILDNFELPFLDDDIPSTYKSNKRNTFMDKKIMRENQFNNHIIKDGIQSVNKAYDSGNKWRSSESLHDQKPVNPFPIENGLDHKESFKKNDVSQAKILNIKTIDVPKPTFDRSNKPATLLQQNIKAKVIPLMENLYSVKKSYEELDRTILHLEDEWLQSKLIGEIQSADIAHDKFTSHQEELKTLVNIFSFSNVNNNYCYYFLVITLNLFFRMKNALNLKMILNL